jgi:two-component system LytT family response regulator
MKVLVVDNEVNVRESFVDLILKNCAQVNEVVQANGVKTGLQAIQKHQPDLVFLDVEMDDGTGMDLMQQLSSFDFQLVFITAFNKYAIDAFKFSAIDFLLKPVNSYELIRSVDRAQKNIKSKKLAQQLTVLQESLQTIKSTDKKIVLNDSESMHFIKISEIIRCEADGAYTKFIFAQRKEILVSSTLKDYEEILLPYGFSRVHNSHIINLNKIIRFDRKDGGFLVMENNDTVPISKRKKDELAHIIKQM